jgi:hypothetical protein
MTEQEIQEIYNRLLALTKAQAIKWEKIGESEYSVNFSRSSVTVGKDYEYDPLAVAMKIYNQEGLLVAYAASPDDLLVEDGVERFNLDPSELFNLAQSEVYRYSETSKNILNELRELDASLKKTA